MGRRGLVGLFTTHGAKGRRFESRPFHIHFRDREMIQLRDDKIERSTVRRPRENEKGGRGEERWNDRQANEEWLREMIRFKLAIRLNG